jgi:cell division transport system permease protein
MMNLALTTYKKSMSFIENSQRIVRAGFTSFWRNKFVTVSAILIMTVTLFIMGSLLFIGAMLDTSLDQISEKVDINVYFTTDANESDILALQSALESRDDVAAVEYISQQEALDTFRSANRDDDLIIQALEELEDNPLGAYFNVQATDSQYYEDIANYLESDAPVVAGSQDIIDRVNFQQNREAIDRLTSIIQSLDTFSFLIIIVFALIAALIVFNTIRLAIFSSRDEISVMELMGASRSYVRGPFVLEGVMYGIVAALLTLILFYPISLWGEDFTSTFFGGTGSFTYFINNFGELFIILTVTGIILGGISSYIAVRKYLDV